MKKKYCNYLLIILVVLFTNQAQGQGCSDAGFCTINSFKPNQSDSIAEVKSQLKAGASFGGADHSISIFAIYLEYNRKLNERIEADAKITSLSQTGNDIAAFGLSDIYLNTTYAICKKAKLTAGVKIPLTNGNRIKDDLPLPMDYQSSLGTFDLIFGLAYNFKNFQLVAAMQQPLTQNKSEFISEAYPENSPLRGFQSTNEYKRSGDVLLRLSYPVKMNKKLVITPSLLPIYHLLNDKYTDTMGIEKSIDGSQGLTLNGNLYFDYHTSTKSALQLSLGVPLVVRDARPDGLTRHFVMNLEFLKIPIV